MGPIAEKLKMTANLDEIIRKAAVLNAIRHDGKADPGAVLGNLLGENPDLKSKAKELMLSVQRIVKEVNATPLEELTQQANEKWATSLVKEKHVEERKLPPLPNAEKYQTIVTRVAPNPDFVLQLGNARAAILSHDYARMYKGKFIVRFEDTDPRLKKAQLQFYDLIREDLKWLGCGWDEECIQSDRLLNYYQVAETLLAKGAAYICLCKPELWRGLVASKQPCPDRSLSVARHAERWQKMMDGGYGEGEAVFRVKTDLSHPNPAVRDWPGFRIVDVDKTPHPRVGSQYRVWPLYNISSGVDDHELGITHVLRGKEHLTNMARQLFLYKHLGWTYPEAVHFGRLKVEGMNLSKSRMMKALDAGEYQSVDDPRLGTLAAMRRRGYTPESIRQLMWEVGPKPVDVTISWDNLNAINRKIIDATSHRYFFVPDPIHVNVNGVEDVEVHAPLHPQHPEMGARTLRIRSQNGTGTILLAGSDRATLAGGKLVRLMGLFNIRPLGFEKGQLNAEVIAQSMSDGDTVPILQWVPLEEKVPVSLVLPNATVVSGFAERALKDEATGSEVQFVRVGFCRVDGMDSDRIRLYFTHD
jgi:glutamyl-tRNA synthetase